MSGKLRPGFLCLALAFCFSACPCAFSQGQSSQSARLDVHSGWQLQSSCVSNASGAQISAPDFPPAGWHATTVPSTVLAALVADGTYPNPDYGMNLRKIPGTTYPIGANFANLPMPKDSPFACSWWYRTELNLPQSFQDRTVWLHFDGINYRANIWMNGKKLADASDVAGTYRIYDFDVTQFTKPGSANVIAVETFAPTENDLAMNWVDWNPAPPDKDMGLWGDVYLTSSGPVALRYPEVITHFSSASLDEADLTVTAQLRNTTNASASAVVSGTIDKIHFEQTVQLNPNETRDVTFTPAQFPQLRLAHPKVWWPYGLGPQNLENLTMQVGVGAAVSDQQNIRFGIREIASTMQPGNHLLFHINGQKILIRGGGWAPDMLMRQPPHKLEAQFDYVREMGLNTIRLEGKLEPEDFFNLADQRGVLVLAGWCCCSIWEEWRKWHSPDLQIATAQLRSQILRLRGHPSLLVWLNGSDIPPPADVETAYLNIEHELQWPNPVISSADVRPTSVSGPSGVKEGPYDYVSPQYWYDNKAHGGAFGFDTETSAGAAPMVEGSLKKTMPADQIWPPNEYWHFHSGSGEFQNLAAFDDAMNQVYGPAKDLQDYERKAQVMAYENERAMYEAYARNKYNSTGVIQWMLNNAWPSLFWHLYDYYLQPAGGYFGAKKANEMLHVQYSYDDRTVVVVNSFYHPFPGLTVSANLYDFNLKPIFSRRSSVDVSSDASQRILTIPPFPQTAVPQTYFLKLELHDRTGKSLSSNFYWLSSKQPVFEWYWTTYERTEEYSYQDLTMLAQLPIVRLDATANRDSAHPGEVSVRLRNPSDHLAFQARLAINDANGNEILPVLWGDNYTELMPGESKIIIARFPSWISVPPGAKLKLTGWNIEPVTIEISSTRGAADSLAPPSAKAAFR